MDIEQQFLNAIECHAVEDIRAAFDAGLDPRSTIRDRTLVEWMTEMYTRGPRFTACLQTLLDAGAVIDDPAVRAVLLDDGDTLADLLTARPELLDHRVTMACAFAPLEEATLLHVAAEFGRARAARVLIEMGADLEAGTAVDEHGVGGHTPLFQAVNSNRNHARPVMKLLLDAGARTDVRLHAITWGKGFDWETTIYDVTPISFAQAGLLPQMHRDQTDTYDNIEALLEASNRPVPPRANVPNEYLKTF